MERGRADRKEMAEQQEAAVKMQAVQRGKAARKEVEVHKNAAPQPTSVGGFNPAWFAVSHVLKFKNILKRRVAEKHAEDAELEPASNELDAASGMYRRWDPNAEDAASKSAPAAWASALAKFKSLPAISENGFESMDFMINFEKEAKSWEAASDMVIPWFDYSMTKPKLTRMLRSRGAIGEDVSVASLERKPLDLQGFLSQTFRYKITYDGGTGPPSLIAKFAPVAKADFRFLCGSQCLKAFNEEVTVYKTGFLTKIGACSTVGGQAQPACYFAAYDDVREAYCLLLEDFGLRELGAGDQNSGGPAKDAPPSLEAFSAAFKAAGDLNGKFFNATKEVWEDGEHKIVLKDTFLGRDWPEWKSMMVPAWTMKYEHHSLICRCIVGR